MVNPPVHRPYLDHGRLPTAILSARRPQQRLPQNHVGLFTGPTVSSFSRWRLIPLSQVSLDSEPPTEHDRGRFPFLTRSSHFSNDFRTKRIAPSSCLSAAGRMASFVLGAVGSGVTC